ncbi:chemotaxis protein CheA [Ramlibacter sp. RBP-2]|uniref:Chemotaxis protein CheA n=1 Tax=Ramlibacter lithotrophicus TaxID=2606681 RepID=A0A7X6DFC5_9BURK|nr:chemotaxis protein CheA [Ramlibacter lithotrophicus]NKE66140.1 chemotaxis protein CheA [Ramlibacter lithotrophicus]
MDIQQFSQAFFVEAAELLAEAEQLLLAIDPGAPSADELNAIFRAAHSIKGGAATFGFQALAETTHLMESHLDRARTGQLALTPAIVDVLLQAKDALGQQLAAYSAGEEPDATAVAHICGQLRGLDQAAGPPVTRAAPAAAGAAAPGRSGVLGIAFERLSGKDRELLLQELANLGRVLDTRGEGPALRVELETSCTPDDIEAVCCFLIEPDQIRFEPAAGAATPADVPGGAAPQPAPDPGAAAAKPAAASGRDAASIRVDVGKVDKLINLVGELVITQAMLTEAASVLDPVLYERLLSGLGHLERNALDLQESVMSIRMMPMDSVFSRYPRLIRDFSAKTGKQVRLETSGKETELDKGLIERIVDPLTHLVRNSLDHGIETPQQRLAAGKEPTGRLLLAAQHRGGNIVIEVTDDGAGLNRGKILAKARQQGLPVSDEMSDDEVWQLIFAPGFSTAEVVTDISGRGVGMDVVKRNIQAMGGHVELTSRAGQGTTTRIVLPLTLAILNGMSVRVGREIYILPLNCVVESLQPSPEHLHSITGDRHVVRVRGEYLPLVALHQVFLVPDANTELLDGILVIVQVGDSRLVLLVDELVGQHQVVVKNLETNYRRVPGISAATILGDGSVALILDVPAMQRLQGACAASEQVLAAAARRDVATA